MLITGAATVKAKVTELLDAQVEPVSSVDKISVTPLALSAVDGL